MMIAMLFGMIAVLFYWEWCCDDKMTADDDDVNNDQPWDDDARRRMEGDMLLCVSCRLVLSS